MNIDHNSYDISHLSNQMKKENVDVLGDMPFKNDASEMSMREESKSKYDPEIPQSHSAICV